VQVCLVDADGEGQAELPDDLDDSVQVVAAGDRRLGDHQDQVGAGERGDHGAADAGRPVDDDQGKASLLGDAVRLVAHQRDELAGVVFGDSEPCVDQRSEARL